MPGARLGEGHEQRVDAAGLRARRSYATPTTTFDEANAYFNEFFATGKPPAGDPPATLDGGVAADCAGRHRATSSST